MAAITLGKDSTKGIHGKPASTWTLDDVKGYLAHPKNENSDLFFSEMYGWSGRDCESAKKQVWDLLDKSPLDKSVRFPAFTHTTYHHRQEIERQCANTELFQRRQRQPPSARPQWYVPELYINGRAGKVSQKDAEYGVTVGFVFLQQVWARGVAKSRREEKNDAAEQKSVVQQKRKISRPGSINSRVSKDTYTPSTVVTDQLKRRKLSSQHTQRKVTESADDTDKIMYDKRPPAPTLAPLDTCFICFGRVTHDGTFITVNIDRVHCPSILDGTSSRIENWPSISHHLGGSRVDRLRLVYFLDGQYKIDHFNMYTLVTAVKAVWLLSAGATWLTIFLTESPEIMESFPDDLRGELDAGTVVESLY